MGYAGGHTPDPDYGDLGDHSESIQIDYDPRVLRYEQLLKVFFEGHRAERPACSRQYRSAILYRDEAQRQAALAALAEREKQLGKKLCTAVEPLGTFTQAEDYHQKYYLRQTPPLYRELARLYPDEADFVRSTAAARVNGYLGGFGTAESLRADLPRLGLSPAGQQELLKTPRRLGCGG